jgi:NADH dehydrogenase
VLDRFNLRLGAAVGHDPAARTVTVRNHTGETGELRYDQLVLSVGSVSRTVPVPAARSFATAPSIS